MQTGKKLGMVTLNDALLELVTSDKIDADEALKNAPDRGEFAKLLQARNIPFDDPGID